MKELTLYVQASANSVTVLKYVRRNIDKIMNSNAEVVCCKVQSTDVDMATRLRKMNITQLPACHTGNKVIIGSEKIIEFFERNIGRKGGKPAARASVPCVDDYMRDEIYRDIEIKDRKVVDHQADDRADEEIGDVLSRVDAMNRRRGSRAREDPYANNDEEPSRGGGQQGGNQRGQQRGRQQGGRRPRGTAGGASRRGQMDMPTHGLEVDPDEPDYDEPDETPHGRGLAGQYRDLVDDQTDQKMLDALLNNTSDAM